MNIIRTATVLVLLSCGSAAAEEYREVSVLEKEISLSEEQLIVFELALDELKRRNLNVKDYKASLYKFGENYIVIFEDPASSPSQRGSGSKIRSFEVELSSDHKVIRANFSR